MLLRIIAGRKREPRFNSHTGEYELYAKGGRLLSLCCLLSPLLLLLLVVLGQSRNVLWTATIAVLVAEGWVVLDWFLSESVFFTDAYVRRLGPFRRRVQIAWCDLAGVKVKQYGELVLTDEACNKVVIANDLHGQRVFHETLRRVARPELIEPIRNDLVEREKLVC